MGSKPIKRNEHIITLSREHHFSLLFSWKVKTGLKKGIDLKRIHDYVIFFWEEHTIQHFRQEEEVLFAVHNDELVDKALAEHKVIREKILALEKWNGEDDISEQLMEVADMITDHVRYEERDLFPHLEQILTPEQLKQIGHELLEMQPEPLQDDYEDQFWESDVK